MNMAYQSLYSYLPARPSLHLPGALLPDDAVHVLCDDLVLRQHPQVPGARHRGPPQAQEEEGTHVAHALDARQLGVEGRG